MSVEVYSKHQLNLLVQCLYWRLAIVEHLTECAVTGFVRWRSNAKFEVSVYRATSETSLTCIMYDKIWHINARKVASFPSKFPSLLHSLPHLITHFL